MLTPVLLMCVCHVRILWGVGVALIMLTITIISSNMILEVIMLVELLSRRSVLSLQGSCARAVSCRPCALRGAAIV
jgi:hypothetical protein